MERETGVLQDRIEIAAFERRVGNAQEWVRGGKNEKLEGGRDPGLHRERIGLELHRQIAAEGRNQRAEQRKNKHPQHHGAFVVSPDAGKPIHQRHRRIRILIDVEHREVGGDVASGERAERQRNKDELRQRRGRRHAEQRWIVAARADDRHRALDQRQAERQHQRVMAEFGDHLPASCRRHRRPRAVIVLPMPRLFQRVGDLLRHVGLIVFGEDRVGGEQSGTVQRAFGDDALPFPEQVGQHALIGDRYLAVAVGDVETDFQIVAAHQASGLHQAAEPHAGAGGDALLRDVARRIEEHDGIAKRVEHQRHRNGEHAERAADQDEASPLASHGWRFPGMVSPSL